MSLMGEENIVNYGEYDDDAYYLELRRRILLLMVDDEEEEGDVQELERNYGQSWSRYSTGFPTAIQHPRICQRISRWESENTSHEMPTWMGNLRRNVNGGTGNGTGVFIPQAVKPRRRHRPAKKNKSGGRMYQQAASP